jgi:Dienelactone hydrolase family
MNAAPHLGKIAFDSTTSRGEAGHLVFVSLATGDDMNSYCDIAASDGSGSMKAYLSMPAGRPKAGIVVIQEILGVNKDIRAMTDAWAANGYAAIAPDLF